MESPRHALLSLFEPSLPAPFYRFDGASKLLEQFGAADADPEPLYMTLPSWQPALPSSPVEALGPWAGGFGATLESLRKEWLRKGQWGSSLHFSTLTPQDQKLFIRQRWASLREHLTGEEPPDVCASYGESLGQMPGAARGSQSSEAAERRVHQTARWAQALLATKLELCIEIPHPWVLSLGRHLNATGSASSVPPPLSMGLQLLRRHAPEVHKRVSEVEAHPSTELVQMVHLSQFGAAGQPMPCGALARVLVQAAEVIFHGASTHAIPFADLRPAEPHMPPTAKSCGMEATLDSLGLAFLAACSNDPCDERGTLGGDRAAKRRRRPRIDEVYEEILAAAQHTFDLMDRGFDAKVHTPCLSAGRATVRVKHGGPEVRAGGRLVWNSSKMANVLFAPLATAMKRALCHEALPCSLLGQSWQHTGGLRFIARCRGSTVKFAFDLPRCDANFSSALLGLLLHETRTRLIVDDQEHHSAYWRAAASSLTVNTVILPSGAAFLKLFGLSSGHVLVSLIETAGGLVKQVAFLMLLHQLAHGPHAAPLTRDTLLRYVNALGDDGLMQIEIRTLLQLVPELQAAVRAGVPAAEAMDGITGAQLAQWLSNAWGLVFHEALKPGSFDVSVRAEARISSLGMLQGDAPHILAKWVTGDGLPVRDVCTTFERLIHPERGWASLRHLAMGVMAHAMDNAGNATAQMLLARVLHLIVSRAESAGDRDR